MWWRGGLPLTCVCHRLLVLVRGRAPQNKKFFEDVEVDELDEMETFLSDVVLGKVPAQREGLWGLPQRLWRRFMEWYPTSAVLAAGLVLVLGLGAWYGARSSVEAEKPHGD